MDSTFIWDNIEKKLTPVCKLTRQNHQFETATTKNITAHPGEPYTDCWNITARPGELLRNVINLYPGELRTPGSGVPDHLDINVNIEDLH